MYIGSHLYNFTLYTCVQTRYTYTSVHRDSLYIRRFNIKIDIRLCARHGY